MNTSTLFNIVKSIRSPSSFLKSELCYVYKLFCGGKKILKKTKWNSHIYLIYSHNKIVSKEWELLHPGLKAPIERWRKIRPDCTQKAIMTNGSGSYFNYTSGYKTFYFALKITVLSVWNLTEQWVRNLNRSILKYKQSRRVSPYFFNVVRK